MKDPTFIVVSIAVIVALVGAGGWWYAQREAAKEVRKALVDADLVDRIAYGDVSYNPLTGTVIIRDIRPVGDEIPVQVKADALEILEWDRGDDLFTRKHVKVVNLRIDVMEAARNEFEKNAAVLAVSFRDPPVKILEHPLQALVVLGYREVIINVETSSFYDPAQSLMKVTESLKIDRMGEIQLNLALAGLTPNLIRRLIEIGKQASTGNQLAVLGGLGLLSGQKKDLEQISLADFGLSYDDSGLARRLKQYHDLHKLRLPSEPSDLELSDEQVEGAAALGALFGLREDKVRSSAQAVANFSKNPNRLYLRTRIDEPIPLSRLADERGTVNALGKLILLTNAEITN